MGERSLSNRPGSKAFLGPWTLPPTPTSMARIPAFIERDLNCAVCIVIYGTCVHACMRVYVSVLCTGGSP